MSGGQPPDDEAYALALQEKFRLEFIQRQERRSHRTRATAPVESPGVVAASSSGGDDAVTRRRVQEERDAELARRLASGAPETLDQDEALARRLAAHGLGPTVPSSSPPRATSRNRRTSPTSADEEYARRLASQETSVLTASVARGAARAAAHSRSNDVTDEDARFAQQLQDQERAYRRYGGVIGPDAVRGTAVDSNNNRNSMPNAGFTDRATSFFMDERMSSDSMDMGEGDDLGMAEARRVAQELQDEETARRYATFEQEAADRREAQELARQSARQNQRRHNAYYYMGFIPCCILGTVIALILVFFVFGGKRVDDVVDGIGDWSFDDWIDIDPFDGYDDDGNIFNGGGEGGGAGGGGGGGGNQGDPSNAFRWRNRGQGLELEILNALDDSWQTTFDTAIAEWDQGTPDSLSLFVTQVEPESVCEAVDDKMKVCNGNYGDTGWRGLNEVLLDRRTNIITSSAARMNEYYLRMSGLGNALLNQARDQRQYTMCHELGHGLGLPHWDEDFYNKNLGNCMDYTNNPSANKQPSESNFIFLADLYGSVDGTYVRNVTHPGASGGFSALGGPSEEDEADNKKDKKKEEEEDDESPGDSTASAARDSPGNRRNLRQSHKEEQQAFLPLPDWVMPVYREVRNKVLSGQPPDSREFKHRFLHQSEHGHAFEVALDDAGQFSVQFHFLSAPSNRERV